MGDIRHGAYNILLLQSIKSLRFLCDNAKHFSNFVTMPPESSDSITTQNQDVLLYVCIVFLNSRYRLH